MSEAQHLLYHLDVDPKKINDQNILITGGTGSFGNKMVATLLINFKPRRVIIYSRDEFKQSLMKEKFNPKKYPNLRYFIGDVRDYDRLETALRNVDLVFHASALKRIQECEYNPMEAIKTNILGTNNLIKAAIKNQVKYVIGLSTDKACSPVNLYGATKLCGEKLLINANILSGEQQEGTTGSLHQTKFATCRYGNVMGSRGSLFQIFASQLQVDKSLTVTDPSMTRFTMLLEEAVNFVLNCYDKMTGGEVFIPKLPKYSIEQVLRCFDAEDNYQIIGARPGEKFHELMISSDESHTAYEFKDFYILTPLDEYGIQHFNIDAYSTYDYQKRQQSHPYSSQNAESITDERLKSLIALYES